MFKILLINLNKPKQISKESESIIPKIKKAPPPTIIDEKLRANANSPVAPIEEKNESNTIPIELATLTF